VTQLERDICQLRKLLDQCEHEKKCLAEKLRDTAQDRDRIQAELARVTEALRHTRHKLEHAETRIEWLKEKVSKLEDAWKKAEADLATANQELKETEEELDKCEEQNIRLDGDLRHATAQIQELQSRLDRRAAWFWALAFLAVFLVILLLICLWFARYRAWMLQRSVEDARNQRERDLVQLAELGNRYAGAKSRVIAYKRQLEDLNHTNMHLHSLKDEYKTHKAFAEQRAAAAEERALGATRETRAGPDP
jgi:chromosome segregation ATPase